MTGHTVIQTLLTMALLGVVPLGCASTETIEGTTTDPEGEAMPVVFLNVTVEERILANRLESQVCTPNTREFDDPYDPNAAKWRIGWHVRSTDGPCARVEFTCRNGATSTKTICADDGHVDTGCTSTSGRRVMISVQTL